MTLLIWIVAAIIVCKFIAACQKGNNIENYLTHFENEQTITEKTQ